MIFGITVILFILFTVITGLLYPKIDWLLQVLASIVTALGFALAFGILSYVFDGNKVFNAIASIFKK